MVRPSPTIICCIPSRISILGASDGMDLCCCHSTIEFLHSQESRSLLNQIYQIRKFNIFMFAVNDLL